MAGGSPRLDRIALVTTVLGLTPHFRTIIATDASPRQIAQSRPDPKVTCLVAPAERTPLKDTSLACRTCSPEIQLGYPLGLSFVLKKR